MADETFGVRCVVFVEDTCSPELDVRGSTGLEVGRCVNAQSRMTVLVVVATEEPLAECSPSSIDRSARGKSGRHLSVLTKSRRVKPCL